MFSFINSSLGVARDGPESSVLTFDCTALRERCNLYLRGFFEIVSAAHTDETCHSRINYSQEIKSILTR